MFHRPTKYDPNMNELLIGTRNRGKIRELEELLGVKGLRLVGLDEFDPVREPVEDGSSFAENAEIKARYYARKLGMTALADDSGLEVEALGGQPGVVSARYSGPGATDSKNNAKLLTELDSLPEDKRNARFVCEMCIAQPDGSVEFAARGTCEGRIAFEESGEGGFGYDPLFIPEGYVETFGELPPEVKSRLSHRASAARKIKGFLVRNSPEAT